MWLIRARYRQFGGGGVLRSLGFRVYLQMVVLLLSPSCAEYKSLAARAKPNLACRLAGGVALTLSTPGAVSLVVAPHKRHCVVERRSPAKISYNIIYQKIINALFLIIYTIIFNFVFSLYKRLRFFIFFLSKIFLPTTKNEGQKTLLYVSGARRHYNYYCSSTPVLISTRRSYIYSNERKKNPRRLYSFLYLSLSLPSLLYPHCVYPSPLTSNIHYIKYCARQRTRLYYRFETKFYYI